MLHNFFFIEAALQSSASSTVPEVMTVDKQIGIVSDSLTTVFYIINAFVVVPRICISAYEKFSFQRKQDLNVIDLIEKIDHSDKKMINEIKKSYLFGMITNREASIEKINQILSCAEPHEAMRIYSKRPSYIHFNSDGRLSYPTNLRILSYIIYSQILIIIGGIILGFQIIRLVGISLPLT